MKKFVIIISWILVIAWMGLIFYFSSVNGVESTKKSTNLVETTIKKTVEKTNEVGITNKNPESKKVKEVAKELNYPFRKGLHILEYFILTLLLINAFYQSGLRGKKIFIFSIIICFLYACSDEFHQTFTERTASLLDIMIDTSGGVLALILILVIKKIKNIRLH